MAAAAALLPAYLPASAQAAAPAAQAPSAAVRAAAAPSEPVSWLSTGDSYSSGEGITGAGAYGGTDYCAQSKRAYGPRAAELLRTQRSWRIGSTAFSACTGLLFGDWYNASTPDRGSLLDWTNAQTRTRRFDVATFSFGGNDIGFAPLLFACLGIPEGIPTSWEKIDRVINRQCRNSEAELTARVDALMAGTPAVPKANLFGEGGTKLSVPDFYAKFANTHLDDDGVLVVVGYPDLFAPSGSWGNWRGGRCNMFSAADADMLARVNDYLGLRLQEAISQAESKLQGNRVIRYVSRDNLYAGAPNHSLCGEATEWMNGITLGFWDGSGRPMHSFHPNDLGHAATAEAVATLVEAELGEPDAAPVTQQPQQPVQKAPIEDPAADFDVGDPFADRCQVAWPTAPTYTTTSIIMTMRCMKQPQQYLFVQVSYPDPNLPVNPSTGYMQVRGQIVDASRSAYGFRQLIVQADEVKLP